MSLSSSLPTDVSSVLKVLLLPFEEMFQFSKNDFQVVLALLLNQDKRRFAHRLLYLINFSLVCRNVCVLERENLFDFFAHPVMAPKPQLRVSHG